MGMTMTQKILAAHAGLDHVTAGQLIECELDVVMANDITGPMALPIFRQMADKVFDKDKVVLVPDHFTPNKDIKSAQNARDIQDFSREKQTGHFPRLHRLTVDLRKRDSACRDHRFAETSDGLDLKREFRKEREEHFAHFPGDLPAFQRIVHSALLQYRRNETPGDAVGRANEISDLPLRILLEHFRELSVRQSRREGEPQNVSALEFTAEIKNSRSRKSAVRQENVAGTLRNLPAVPPK